jgi:hypothetical protein
MKNQRPPRPVPVDAVYISAAQVCNRYGGRSHMWLERQLQNNSEFPRPEYFGRLRFFRIVDLENYERNSAASRIAERSRVKEVA